jgi:hypothetical protein
MSNITINDIFGNKATNKSPFIIINMNGDDIRDYLITKDGDNHSGVDDYDYEMISKKLKSKNLDPNVFGPLGSLLHTQTNVNPTSLILGNKSICVSKSVVPDKWIKYGNGTLVSTTTKDKKYVSLGFAYTLTHLSILPKILLVPKSIIKTITTGHNLLTSNEYFLVSSGLYGIRTIDINKLKYMIASNNLTSILNQTPDDKKHGTTTREKIFTYNTQGELITKSPILCNSDNSNNIGNIDENSVLTSSSDNNWSEYKGKSVVLVKSNNPWYVNKDTTVIMKHLKANSIDNDLKYRNNADYDTNFKLDEMDPTLGFGYSYSDRNDTSCKTENFTSGEDFDFKNTNNQIIMAISCALLIIVLYKTYKQMK